MAGIAAGSVLGCAALAALLGVLVIRHKRLQALAARKKLLQAAADDLRPAEAAVVSKPTPAADGLTSPPTLLASKRESVCVCVVVFLCVYVCANLPFAASKVEAGEPKAYPRSGGHRRGSSVGKVYLLLGCERRVTVFGVPSLTAVGLWRNGCDGVFLLILWIICQSLAVGYDRSVNALGVFLSLAH